MLFKGKENLKQNQETFSWCHRFRAGGSPLHVAVGEDTAHNPYPDGARWRGGFVRGADPPLSPLLVLQYSRLLGPGADGRQCQQLTT